MPSEPSNFEHVTCSRCGQKITSLKECVGIRDNSYNPLCDVCYQHMLFPNIKDYDSEMLDYSALPGEI